MNAVTAAPTACTPAVGELGRLKSLAAALEQLLDVHETTSLEQAVKLEQSLREKDELLERERAAQLAIQQSEERHRTALERYQLVARATNDVIWDWDVVTNELLWNDAIHTTFRFPPDAVAHTIQFWYDHIHPEDRDRVLTGIHRVIDSGNDAWSDEYRFLLGDGEFATVFDRGHVARNERGEAIRMLGAMIDLTTRKRAEKALRDSEERYRSLVDASRQLVWTTTAEGEMSGEQPGWAAFTGQSRSAYQDHGWADSVHPDDRTATLSRWRHTVITRSMLETEHRVRRRDGVYRLFSVRAVPVIELDGGIREWVGVHTDVTEEGELKAARDRALAETEAARKELQRVFMQAPAAIATTRGPEHVFETVNPLFLQLVGQRELVGVGIRRAIPELSGQGFFELLDRVYETRQPFLGNEVPAVLNGPVASESSERFFNFVYQPLLDAEDSILGIMIHAVEVTEQVHARRLIERTADELRRTGHALEEQAEESAALTEELETANQHLNEAMLDAEQARERAEAARVEAEEANKAKAEFLASMSHELRTPLNAIGGYAQLLAEGIRGPINDAQRYDLERIKRGQHTLLALINDILNFAKIEAGRVRFEPKDVPMITVLGQLEALVAPQLLQKRLHYQNNCGDPSYTAYVDPERLQQILLNLLSNAVKFTPDGGEITLDCSATDDEMHVRVSDSGVGIPADKLDSIFEPFVQLDRGQSSTHAGTGLGLSISRDLARAMRGELSAESPADAGSTFTLKLPRRPP